MVDTVATSIMVDSGVEQAWEAWTTPDALARWSKPSAASTCRVLSLEPRVGGRWSIQIHQPDGASYRVGGRYLVLDRPRHLRFTWTWEEGGPAGFHDETTVDVRLEREGARTRIGVQHARIPPALAKVHREGWNAALRLIEDQRSEQQ